MLVFSKYLLLARFQDERGALVQHNKLSTGCRRDAPGARSQIRSVGDGDARLGQGCAGGTGAAFREEKLARLTTVTRLS